MKKLFLILLSFITFNSFAQHTIKDFPRLSGNIDVYNTLHNHYLNIDTLWSLIPDSINTDLFELKENKIVTSIETPTVNNYFNVDSTVTLLNLHELYSHKISIALPQASSYYASDTMNLLLQTKENNSNKIFTSTGSILTSKYYAQDTTNILLGLKQNKDFKEYIAYITPLTDTTFTYNVIRNGFSLSTITLTKQSLGDYKINILGGLETFNSDSLYCIINDENLDATNVNKFSIKSITSSFIQFNCLSSTTTISSISVLPITITNKYAKQAITNISNFSIYIRSYN